MSRKSIKIVWSSSATSELRAIGEYIRQFNSTAAKKVKQQIKEAVRQLARFPLSGRIVPEFPDEYYRELIVGNYRVIYYATEVQVEILKVVHGARDLTSLPPFDKE